MAAKGGQIPTIKLSRTQIGEFDEFFDEAKDPLSTLVGWNNDMDSNTVEFRKIGAELRKESQADAPPSQGDVKVSITDDGLVAVTVENNGEEVKKFDKATNEYAKTVQTKVKKVNDRLKTLRKKEGFADAKLALNNKNEVYLDADAGKLSENENESFVSDLQRSLLKLNGRKELFDLQLKGPVTLVEAISGFFNSLKSELEKKKQALKVAISNSGLPTLDGIPDDLEDFLPSLLVRAYKLFMGFVELIQSIIEGLPELQPKIEALVEKAKEFPSQASSAASSAGLSGMQIPKAIKAVGNNVKALGSAPEIIKQLSETVKDTTVQLADAATGNKAE